MNTITEYIFNFRIYFMSWDKLWLVILVCESLHELPDWKMTESLWGTRYICIVFLHYAFLGVFSIQMRYTARFITDSISISIWPDRKAQQDFPFKNLFLEFSVRTYSAENDFLIKTE